MPLTVKFTSTPFKYLKNLDKPTRERIKAKLSDIAKDSTDPRLSKPLQSSEKRAARVGGYRILYMIDGDTLLVADIGPRGQIYRKA